MILLLLLSAGFRGSQSPCHSGHPWRSLVSWCKALLSHSFESSAPPSSSFSSCSLLLAQLARAPFIHPVLSCPRHGHVASPCWSWPEICKANLKHECGQGDESALRLPHRPHAQCNQTGQTSCCAHLLSWRPWMPQKSISPISELGEAPHLCAQLQICFPIPRAAVAALQHRSQGLLQLPAASCRSQHGAGHYRVKRFSESLPSCCWGLAVLQNSCLLSLRSAVMCQREWLTGTLAHEYSLCL